MMVKMLGIASHAGGYTDNPNIELIAASDISKVKLKQFGKRWNVTSLYINYKEMLEKEEIDILSICTWNSTHLDIMEVAVKNNIKAIWCEKPISNSLSSAKKMIKIANNNNVKLAINHSRRWDRLYNDITKFINNGGLGDIQQVSCYYTGGLANTCSHLFDVLRMFLGDAESVSAWINDDPTKDDPNMDVRMRFKNGTNVTVQSVALQSFLVFEIDIYGTNGRLRIQDNGFKLSYWKANRSSKYKGLNELFEEVSPIEIHPKTMITNAIQDIVECLQTGREPACTGEDGYKALELICASKLSVNKNNNYISLPLIDNNLNIKSN